MCILIALVLSFSGGYYIGQKVEHDAMQQEIENADRYYEEFNPD